MSSELTASSIPNHWIASISHRHRCGKRVEAKKIASWDACSNRRERAFSPEHTPQEISDLIGRCDVLVGMRLHSIIFARTHAVPFVAISYDPKVQGALDGQLTKFSIPLPELSTERLDALLEEDWSRRDAIKNAMMKEHPALTAESAAPPAAIRALLRRGGTGNVSGPETRRC